MSELIPGARAAIRKVFRGATVNQIARATGQTVDDTETSLRNLERKGYMRQLDNGRWELTDEGKLVVELEKKLEAP